MMSLENHGINVSTKGASSLAVSARVFRYVLGVLFICAGAAKIPMLNSLASTIVSVTHCSLGFSWVLALLTVTVEIAGGVALLLRYNVQAAALILCIMTAGFLWILSSAILQGMEILCNCFGILGINFSNRTELILDLFIFNSLTFIAWTSSRRTFRSPKHLRRERLYGIVTFIVVIYVEFGLVQLALERPRGIELVPLQPAIHFAEMHSRGFAASAGRPRALFLLSLNDFNCPPCFDDFVLLCDSLTSSLTVWDDERVVALVRPDNPIASGGRTRLEEWARATGIPFPLIAAPDTLFSCLDFRKSLVSVIGSSGKVILRHELPLGVANRGTIVKYLLR